MNSSLGEESVKAYKSVYEEAYLYISKKQLLQEFISQNKYVFYTRDARDIVENKLKEHIDRARNILFEIYEDVQNSKKPESKNIKSGYQYVDEILNSTISDFKVLAKKKKDKENLHEEINVYLEHRITMIYYYYDHLISFLFFRNNYFPYIWFLLFWIVYPIIFSFILYVFIRYFRLDQIGKFMIDNRSKINISNSKIAGGVSTDNSIQVGGIFNDFSSSGDLHDVTEKIEKIVEAFQLSGLSEDTAQEATAKKLANQAKQDPSFLGKLINFGKELGVQSSTSASSEAGKVTGRKIATFVIKKALSLLDINIQ